MAARHATLALILALALAGGIVLAQAPPEPPAPRPWEFLSISAIGADQFLAEQPESDGRGVVIAVLDTGVAAGLPGLAGTPQAAPKILDLRDFSGQGDVALEPALRDEDAEGPGLHGIDGPWLRGLEAFEPQPVEGTVHIGYLRETELADSAAADLDADGDRDDVYGVVVYETPEHRGVERRIIVDTDGDGRLDDESLRADFLEQRETFTLGAPGRREAVPPVDIALNLWEDEPDKVTFVFDDGAHGTHVAGIAAGYQIGGRPGQHGIAPGAQIISLKIGDNTLSGGATTTGSMWRAWNYAAEWSREHDVPVIAQMSYGIGSENEGQSVMEAEIDRLLTRYEQFVGCTSNGNEGPGLSTAGLPSCARQVIATGAVLPRTTAGDLYGARLDDDQVFAFSSRGAEWAKPDLVAPGVAASTVPVWREGRDVMRGTSMASPQTAGAAALLASAALRNDLPVIGAFIKAALRRGAQPLDDVTVLDQGPGMIDVTRAWEIYQALARRPDPEPREWIVETLSPELPGHDVTAAHWPGVLPPREPERQPVTVRPRFAQRVTEQQKAEFYRAFDLVSTARWVQPDKGSVYTRSGRPFEFALSYDHERLREPGLYTARLLAYDKDLSKAERERLGPDWDLPISVVVPHEPALAEVLRRPEVELAPGEVERVFVRVPLGATSMEIRMQAGGDGRQRLLGYVHDPEGRREVIRWVGGEHQAQRVHHVSGPRLRAGVWEIDVYSDFQNSAPAVAELAVRFDPFAIEADRVALSVEAGAPPKGRIELLNRSRETFRGSAAARLVGYRISARETTDRDTIRVPLAVNDEIAGIDLRVELGAETWNRVTDVAVRVLDEDDHAILSDGMGYALLDTRFENPRPGTGAAYYHLEIAAALAEPDASGFAGTVDRTYRYTEPIPVGVEQGGGPLVLYPDHPIGVQLEAERTPPALPDGASWVIELSLTPQGLDESVATIELLARP
jgi:subtilisin family serine protease